MLGEEIKHTGRIWQIKQHENKNEVCCRTIEEERNAIKDINTYQGWTATLYEVNSSYMQRREREGYKGRSTYSTRKDQDKDEHEVV